MVTLSSLLAQQMAPHPACIFKNVVDRLNQRQGTDLRESKAMNLSGAAAILCIILWVVLAFVLAFPTGWVHVPLILGVVLIVRAIVEGSKK